MKNLDQLLRPHIAGLKPYSSARDEFSGAEGVFLDANENPYDRPGSFNRYPDPQQKTLKKLLAGLKNVAPEQIFLGNGSDEAIDLLFRLFCRAGRDNVIIMPPTYGMYEVSAGINQTEVRRVNLSTDFGIRTEEVLAAADENTKMIFVCSPNNPTGNALDEENILKICREFPGITVIDEAYIDFSAGAGFLSRLKELPGAVVLQTLSKAWGLAGLRIGAAFASPEIVALFNKIKPPYNISQIAQNEAIKILSEPGKVQEKVAEILEERNLLAQKLSELPEVETVYPSDANFLLIKIKKARDIYEKLVGRQIIVRDRSRTVLCGNCLRITVGTPAENRDLLEQLAGL